MSSHRLPWVPAEAKRFRRAIATLREVAHAPTAPGKRQFQLDVLRGLALFGVLLENLQHFVVPSYATYAAGPAATVFDHAALGAVRALCDNKVYAIFAFLFGYGIALQMKRVDTDFVGLQIWRMAILFLIGLAHSLLWDGDILTTYALLGLLLIPLRNQSDSFFGSVTLAGLVAPFTQDAPRGATESEKRQRIRLKV